MKKNVSSPTKILLSGCCGNMGRTVTKVAENFRGAKINCGLDVIGDPTLSYTVFRDFSDVNLQTDVIIDFSHPSLVDRLFKYAVSAKLPSVICTTGLSQEQVLSVKKAAKEIPVFFSSNMSIGINLLAELAAKAAKILQDNFDIEIIEKHHNQKIDAPSGTAFSIAGAISNVVSFKPEYVYNRHNFRQKRSKHEIGMHAIRGGTIVGEHTVMFAGADEVIEITHSASSKEVFAVGAIRAAMFLVRQPVGLYSMKDLINEVD